MFGPKSGPIWKQFAVVVVANLTFFHFGLGIAWISPVLVKIGGKNATVLSRPITDEEGIWLASCSILAGLPVMALAGFFSNHFGRKRTILIFCAPRLVSCILLLFTSEVWMLVLARCISGLSDLLHISVTSTYSSEIASKEIRGALGMVSQILSSLGGMIMLTIGPFVSFQSLNIIYTCLIFGSTIPMLFIPETPYFLYFQGRTEESIKVLTHLRGSTTSAQEELVEYSKTEDTKVDLKELLFKDRVVLKTILKVIILAICVQIIGYNFVAFYLQTIFNSTHTEISSEVCSLVIGCIQMFACFCTIFLTDRLGRKPILAATMTGLTVGMIGLGTFFKLIENGGKIDGFLNYLPLISIALVMFSYNAGIGAIIWTVVAEHFDGRFRAFGLSIGVFTSALFAFIITKYFPILVLAIGPATTYYVFSGCCVVTGLFIAFFFNETKGKAFSQIQMELGREFVRSRESKAAM